MLDEFILLMIGYMQFNLLKFFFLEEFFNLLKMQSKIIYTNTYISNIINNFERIDLYVYKLLKKNIFNNNYINKTRIISSSIFSKSITVLSLPQSQDFVILQALEFIQHFFHNKPYKSHKYFQI